MDNNIFSKRLVEIMKSRNLNQLHIANALGIRQSQISNWINGKTFPTYRSLVLFHEKLKIPYEDLF